jgi:RimJ/RimL family protein N-acetyltransferase
MLQLILAIIILVPSLLFSQETSINVTLLDLNVNWQKFVDLHKDPMILRGLGLSVSPENGFFEKHRQRIDQEQKEHSPITTYQITLENNTFIGFVMLCPMVAQDRAEISYVIMPNFQCMGYGRTAITMLCRKILPDSRQSIRLWALVNTENIASQKILSFCGFNAKDDPKLLDNEDIEYELSIT